MMDWSMYYVETPLAQKHIRKPKMLYSFKQQIADSKVSNKSHCFNSSSLQPQGQLDQSYYIDQQIDVSQIRADTSQNNESFINMIKYEQRQTGRISSISQYQKRNKKVKQANRILLNKLRSFDKNQVLLRQQIIQLIHYRQMLLERSQMSRLTQNMNQSKVTKVSIGSSNISNTLVTFNFNQSRQKNEQKQEEQESLLLQNINIFNYEGVSLEKNNLSNAINKCKNRKQVGYFTKR